MRALILIVALSVPGCGLASVLPALQDVIVAVQDAGHILDTIDRVVQVHYRENPNPSQWKYEAAMEKTRRTLNLALRTAKGAEALDQQQTDVAFTEFRAAYEELQALLHEMDLMSEDGMMSFAPGKPQINVAEPMALTLKVRQ